MVKVVTVEVLQTIINKIGLQTFFHELMNQLRQDFGRWHDFHKTPRYAEHYAHGVIELMPISDQQFFTCKYVNGHPNNPRAQLLTVAALGLLADIATGYPLLICEMTLLTALRTAATSALAASYLAPHDSKRFAIIGAGAQAEFQVLAHHYTLGVKQIQYYDRDPKAMIKFANNLANYPLQLMPGDDIPSAIQGADIITTATAAKIQTKILQDAWIEPGVYINAIGGDCPGKTELDPKLLMRSKIVVENLQQSQLEGEIQQIPHQSIYAELWEIINGKKSSRQNNQEIFIFDSVGFALEDYSALRYVYQLAQELKLGQELNLIPQLADPKNLFSLIS